MLHVCVCVCSCVCVCVSARDETIILIFALIFILPPFKVEARNFLAVSVWTNLQGFKIYFCKPEAACAHYNCNNYK